MKAGSRDVSNSSHIRTHKQEQRRKKIKTLSVNHFSQFILDNLRAEMRNLRAALYTQPSMQHFCSLALSLTHTHISHSLSAFGLEALNCFRGWRTLCSSVAWWLADRSRSCLSLVHARFLFLCWVDLIQQPPLVSFTKQRNTYKLFPFIKQHRNNLHSLKTTPMASINITGLT